MKRTAAWSADMKDSVLIGAALPALASCPAPPALANSHRQRLTSGLPDPSPHAPGRACEHLVCDGRKPRFILPQGKQQMGDPVGGRQTPLGDLHAVAVHPPSPGGNR